MRFRGTRRVCGFEPARSLVARHEGAANRSRTLAQRGVKTKALAGAFAFSLLCVAGLAAQESRPEREQPKELRDLERQVVVAHAAIVHAIYTDSADGTGFHATRIIKGLGALTAAELAGDASPCRTPRRSRRTSTPASATTRSRTSP